MTDEDLIGYVLDLLDPADRAAVEARLVANPDGAAHLDRLRAALAPLEADRNVDPPPDLATRTVARLAAHLVEHEPRPAARPADEPDPVPPVPAAGPRYSVLSTQYSPGPEYRSVGGRFRADVVVAAGIGLVALGLVLSAVGKVRHRYQVAACQNNLRTLYQGLTGYADTRGGRFPQVGVELYPTAGSFVTALADAGQCPPGFRPVCPADATEPGPRPAALAAVRYTYSLGHLAPGGVVLGPRRSDGSSDENDLIPTSSDYPAAAVAPAGGLNSPHPAGQNVLFAGGAVRFTTSAAVGPNGDDIYRNQFGRVAAGVDRTDAVLGRAGDRP